MKRIHKTSLSRTGDEVLLTPAGVAGPAADIVRVQHETPFLRHSRAGGKSRERATGIQPFRSRPANKSSLH